MILIKPSIHVESQSPLIAPFIYNTFPTSLGFLAGYLREKSNITPQIIDEYILPLDRGKLEELLKNNEGPKIVGMTVITINSHRAIHLAELIKSIDDQYLTILGGIHPTVLTEDCLNSPYVDMVIRGEGEETLYEIMKCSQSGASYNEIRGMSYKSNGKIVHNPDRSLVNLDSIPPFPYDLFDSTYNFYRDFGTIFSSRGCPYDCIFCSQRAISGQKYRYVSNERVLNEIGVLVNKYDQKKIWFMDDNFLVHKKRAFSLLEGIIEKGFHLKTCFAAEMRGESVTVEMLEKMKEANFQIVSFGMETGSQRLLDLVNKKEKVEDNVRAIKMAHKIGIGTSATFIFGLPTETRKERLDTAKLARTIPLDDARFNIAIPYPGTKLFELASKENRLLIKPGWSNFNVQFYMFGDDIPYVPKDTNKYLLMRDTFMANLRFNLRLKTLINFVLSPISGGMVLTLPKRWYFSVKEIKNIISLGLYIVKRFFKILFMSLIPFHIHDKK